MAGERLDVEWKIALRDLELAIGLDADADGAITWSELQAQEARVATVAHAALDLLADNATCVAGGTRLLVDALSDGVYAVLRWQAACARPVTTLDVRYQLFSALDPQHRGLLALTASDGGTSTAVLDPRAPAQRFQVAVPDPLAAFTRYVDEGVRHVVIGYDHVLFVLCLLLPAVVRREQGASRAIGDLRAAVRDVIGVVTAFTIAHSLTLCAAALQVVTLPSRWVESAVAASIMAVAVANLLGRWHQARARMAFAFGLLHGLAFASVLADVGLPSTGLAVSLAGFNIGVEIAQLAIVLAFLPLAWWLRETAFYRQGVMRGGCVAILLVALGWFIERAWQLDLPVI